MLRFVAALLATLLFAPPVLAVDESDLLPIDQAFALTARATAPDRVEFHWQIAEGYYLYRQRMGVQPAGGSFTVNLLDFPDGDRHTDEFFGEVETYRDEVQLVLTGNAPVGANTATFEVKYQGCADLGVCYPPHRQTLTVALPAATATHALDIAAAPGNDPLGLAATPTALPEAQAFQFEAIVDKPARLLLRFTPAPGYYLYKDKTRFVIEGSAPDVTIGEVLWPQAEPYRDEHFGETEVYFQPVEVPLQLLRKQGKATRITLATTFQGCQTDGICYPPMTRRVELDLPAGGKTDAPDAAPDGVSLWLALVLAMGGGLILNLMPCVLPVLSFKALALAQGGESHARARAHALWYTAGVLVSFAAIGGLVLGLRGAGQALGWGFQLQQPWLIGTLVLLLFAIGLSLSGVWQFGVGLAGSGQSLASKSGPAGDFFTGVLAVVVASPCTAPFMGTALGFAFTASALPALLVFLALGLGLALPFLLIGFVPALASRLPKPGAWMDTLKQWLAFPMYFTAIWLAWVFAKQRGVDALALLLIGATTLAIGLWWFERQRYSEHRLKQALAWVFIALAGVAFAAALRFPNSNTAQHSAEGTVPYSATKLAELRAAGRPVFIDMTADWCITCKVNEKAVLATDTFRALLDETKTVYMVGDWTNEDPEISAFLDQYQAPGVPLYVVFPADGGPGVKLPQVLTPELMRTTLTAAAAR